MIVTKDNHSVQIGKDESMDNLRILSNPTIKDLCSDDGGSALIFPQSFTEYGDNIDKEHIFTIEGERLVTGNIMGFIGYKDTSVTIRSRFTNDEKDYFLHYLLQKVFSINLFDLDYKSDEEQIFDFLVFTFPHFLNKAMRQGLYKEYKTERYNDSNIRGRIDVGRHIRFNNPFIGNIAYDNREFAFDNHVTELIRHTIEYIGQKKYGQLILASDDETMENVRLIRQVTSCYNRQNRTKIMADNVRPVVHPYFYEYRDLQQVCLMILRQEEMKYGKDEREIYGVLFDGAWLWEEYLNTILKRLGFKHPRNKEHTGRLHLFQKEDGKKNRSCYPDFYKDDIILDAKYKNYGSKTVPELNREDLFQVVSYMWIKKAHHGGFIFPLRESENASDVRHLNGYPGAIKLFGINVGSSASSYKEFCEVMSNAEDKLIDEIDNYGQI